MSPTERIILGQQAWRLAARLLRTRFQRLRANRDTWRRLCDDLAICGIGHDVLQDEPCDDFGRTWAARWKAVAHRYRRRSRKAGEHNAYSLLRRVQAEMEVVRLQASLDNANACCNRIQADGNALADQLHAWRQACQDHGITPTPDALRETLHMVGVILERQEARGIVVEADL